MQKSISSDKTIISYQQKNERDFWLDKLADFETKKGIGLRLDVTTENVVGQDSVKLLFDSEIFTQEEYDNKKAELMKKW